MKITLIAVIERNYDVKDPDFRDRYIGAPCRSYDEARELCAAHISYHSELKTECYIDDGTIYAEVDTETGEIRKEFFVRRLN